jgi:hypothetical protein
LGEKRRDLGNGKCDRGKEERKIGGKGKGIGFGEEKREKNVGKGEERGRLTVDRIVIVGFNSRMVRAGWVCSRKWRSD